MTFSCIRDGCEGAVILRGAGAPLAVRRDHHCGNFYPHNIISQKPFSKNCQYQGNLLYERFAIACMSSRVVKYVDRSPLAVRRDHHRCILYPCTLISTKVRDIPEKFTIRMLCDLLYECFSSKNNAIRRYFAIARMIKPCSKLNYRAGAPAVRREHYRGILYSRTPISNKTRTPISKLSIPRKSVPLFQLCKEI